MAASIWIANASTVSPPADTADGRVHVTPANLATSFHRAIEAGQTSRALRAIFADPEFFAHHDPLLSVPQFGDEGATNHTRLFAGYGDAGVELFVYGEPIRCIVARNVALLRAADTRRFGGDRAAACARSNALRAGAAESRRD